MSPSTCVHSLPVDIGMLKLRRATLSSYLFFFLYLLTPAGQLRLERSCLDSGPFDHPTLTVGAKVQIAALIGSVCAVSLLSGTNCRAWLI